MSSRVTAFAAAALLCLVSAGSSIAAAQSPQAVLASYVAWRGGPAFLRLQTIHEQGRITTSGLTGEADRWVTADGRRAQRELVADIFTAEAVAARGAWRTNLSGQPAGLDPAARADARREARLLFAGFFQQPRTRVSRQPDETLDGASSRVVRLQFGGPDAYDFFIGLEGALRAVRITQDNRSRYLRYSDWRVVQGVRVAFRETVGSRSQPSDESFAFDNIALNQGPPAAAFQRPAARARVAFGTGEGWMPFELFAGNRIYLSTVINGQPVQALLDSGAETTAIDSGFADSAGIRPKGEMGVEGSGGSTSSGLATGVSLRVGEASVAGVTASVMDLSSIGKALDIPLRAIVGQELFYASVVDIDFPRRRIAFRDPARFVPPKGAVRLPLEPARGDRTVPLSIEGRPPIRVFFDLGNGSPLDIFAAYWRPQGLLDARPSSQLLNGGAGGQRPVRLAMVKSVSLGGTTLQNVPANFSPPGPTTENSDRVLGNVGLPILQRFRVIADYGRDALYLLPDTAAMDAPFEKDRAGVSAIRETGALRVAFVAPASPALAAGLKAGDRIVAIDGARIGPDFPSSPLSHWRFGAADRRVALTMADGRALVLVLKDYF
jgi:hypothetical protein